jgi:hypothetical protein
MGNEELIPHRCACDVCHCPLTIAATDVCTYCRNGEHSLDRWNNDPSRGSR